VYGKKNLRRLQLCHCLHALAFVPLLKRVAREIRVFVLFTHFQQQIVDWNISNPAAARTAAISASAWLQRLHEDPPAGAPARPCHRRPRCPPIPAAQYRSPKSASAPPISDMLAQPGFQPRAEVAQGKRLRGAIHQVRLAHRLKSFCRPAPRASPENLRSCWRARETSIADCKFPAVRTRSAGHWA